MSDKVIAVVSRTKEQARSLAADLGISPTHVFGQTSELWFEGLRVDLVLVEAGATLPDSFRSTISATAAKSNGRIRVISSSLRSL